MLIMLYIMDESNFDKQFKNADRIYRVSSAVASGKDNEKWAAQPAPVAWALKTEIPGVEQVARLLKIPNVENILLKNDNNRESKRFFESNGYYVDSTFFSSSTIILNMVIFYRHSMIRAAWSFRKTSPVNYLEMKIRLVNRLLSVFRLEIFLIP